MSDRFNLTFTDTEHDLYVFLKSTPGATREIKAFLRRWMQGGENPTAGIQTDADADRERTAGIYELTFGDIVENFGTMRNFIRECGLSAIQGRIITLRANHPQEAADVLDILKANHPELKGRV